jgi:ABC-type multidrug transport system ATPase subunit
LRDLNRKGATFVTATHDGAVSEYCNRVLHLQDGKVISGIKGEGLKETSEQRKTRIEHQEKNKEIAEEKILKTIEGRDKVSIERLRAAIPSEVMELLPMHFDDIIQEMIDKEMFKGKLDKGILYIEKDD